MRYFTWKIEFISNILSMVVGTKLLFFGPNFTKKVFQIWNRNNWHRHWILDTRINLGTKFQLKLIILIFKTNFSQKGYFWSKTEKREKQHWILHIRITLGTNVYYKQTVLNFLIKFAQKGYFQSITEKVKITIDFCIFELVWESNFILNRKFWIFGQICPKRVFPV